MNLLEAIKSGRFFKLPEHYSWCEYLYENPDEPACIMMKFDRGERCALLLEELKREDWEVNPGMNILQAIKSGKLFKRKRWGYWFTINGEESDPRIIYMKETDMFSLADIMADDWEIKNEHN